MKLYILQWNFSDGYNHSNGVLGVYSTEEAATLAGDTWMTNVDAEYETFTLIEVELDA